MRRSSCIFTSRSWRPEDGDPSDPKRVAGVAVARRLATRRDAPGALVRLVDRRYAITGRTVAAGLPRQLDRYIRRRARGSEAPTGTPRRAACCANAQRPRRGRRPAPVMRSGEQLQATTLEPTADVQAEGVRPGGGEGGRGRQLTSVPGLPTSLRVAEPSNGEPHAAQRLEDTRAELDRLSRAYDDALRRGLRARERADIAAAFDEGRLAPVAHQRHHAPRARSWSTQLARSRLLSVHELARVGASNNAA